MPKQSILAGIRCAEAAVLLGLSKMYVPFFGARSSETTLITDLEEVNVPDVSHQDGRSQGDDPEPSGG